jgi:hypothetical protein
MKHKKQKYKTMSDEYLKSGYGKVKNIETIEYNKDTSGVMAEINMFFIFTIFLILSWLGLIKLYQYKYIFTIYRYNNITFSSYFPIQISSTCLLIMTLIIVLIISISCIFFIFKLIINLLKKERTKIFNKMPIIISIPIILNSLLFLLGIIIQNNNEILYFYSGLSIVSISLFVLLKINFDKKIKSDVFMINYESDCMKFFFENVLFEILLAFNIYYCYYVIFQIIYHLSHYSIDILNFSGIIINLSLGLTSLFTNYKLKSIGFNLIYLFIYLGIFIFQCTIGTKERVEFRIGYEEMILSAIFFITFIVEFAYITCFDVEN